MAQLNTRLILRNDSSVNWSLNSSVVLLKGEVGIEYLTDGLVKMKIGDGVKTWAELDYFGDTHLITELQTQLETLEKTVETQTETIKTIETRVENIITDSYTKEQTDEKIAAAIAAAEHLKRKTVVSTESIDVNAEDAEQYIYMVPNDDGSYDEYMVLDSALEKVGNWKTDLTEYAKISDVNAALELKANLSYINDELAKKVNSSDLETALNGKANVADTLAGYGITDVHTKSEIADLIGAPAIYGEEDENGDKTIVTPASGIYADIYTRTEIADLIADITGGESAADVKALLEAYKGTNDKTVAALQAKDTNFEDRIAALELIGADDNVIEAINFNGEDIAIVDKKATFSYTYELPVALENALGGVKSSNVENKISVNNEGLMEVNSLNVNKLVQTAGETLILNGGSAAI